MLERAVLLPHPPIALPEVGGKEAQKVASTYRAMAAVAEEIKALNPEVVVAITPHGHVFSDAVSITALPRLEGSLAQFGAPFVKVGFTWDKEAIDAIVAECSEAPFYCAPLDEQVLKEYGRSLELDHGLVVPLSFVAQSGWRGKLVPVNMGFLNYEELYHFGRLMAQAMERLERRWVLLISGDMSHRLLPGSPHGYSPQGAVFDEIIRQVLREGDVKRIFSLEPEMIEDAGECSLRPIIMGLGALDGYNFTGCELSYEGPFGVGYLVVSLRPQDRSDRRLLVDDLYKNRDERRLRQQKGESEPVRLARKSIGYYLQKRQYLKAEEEIKDIFLQKGGCFVSLKKNGNLRGCVGTIEPTRENLAAEIIHNAVSAAFRDPRFEPLEPEELELLTISVDVLEEPEKISSLAELDAKTFGVIVRKGSRQGLLLPDLPGVNNPEEQVRIARQKAGIRPEEEVEMERFKVTRYF